MELHTYRVRSSTTLIMLNIVEGEQGKFLAKANHLRDYNIQDSTSERTWDVLKFVHLF